MEHDNYVSTRKRIKNSPRILTPDDLDKNDETPSNQSEKRDSQQEEELSSDQNSKMDMASASASKTTSSPDLPWSVMIDVLSRLPINSLMQCSYVCKSWRNLLHESYFYRLYSLHTPSTLILRVKGYSLSALREIHLIESQSPSLYTRKMRVIPSNKTEDLNRLFPEFRFQLGNGCDGLICLREIRTREPKLVWNPVMGQFVVLPKSVFVADDKVVAGFGFCNRTNRYKVVRVFHRVMDPPARLRVQVYDLGVGKDWRDIGDAPFQIPSRIPGFYINYCLHWIIDHNSELICCFDFVEECFRVICPPPIYSPEEKTKYHWSNLGILGGCSLSISAIDANLFRPDVQVWVMEEYGVAESWALRLSIRDPTVDWWDPYRWIQVTNFLRNGEILILCGHCYVLAYDVRERRFRSVEGLVFPAIAHVPSFVSLEDVLREDLGTGSLTVNYL